MEVLLDKVGKLLCDVRVHVEMLVPGCLSSIAVVTGRITYRPVGISSLGASLIDSSRASIGENHHNLALLAGFTVLHLYCSILPRASQTAAEVNGRVGLATLLVHCIIWHVNSESHLAVVNIAPMLNSLHVATKAFDRGDNFDIFLGLCLNLVDVDDTTKTGTLVHSVHQVIYLVKTLELVSDKLFESKFTKKHFVYKLWYILTGFPATESSAFPNATCDELERSGLECLSSSRNSNDT